MSPTIGAPLDRYDGPKKVRGEAKYAADFDAPNIAHAVMVTSTIAAGTLAIDASAVRRMPGVLLVLTPENAPKLPDANKAEPPATRALSLLQSNEVRYNGEPVALVVADTFEHARAAMRAIEPRYEAKSAVLDFATAKTNAYAPEKANQEETDKRWGNYQAGIENAAKTIDGVYTTPN